MPKVNEVQTMSLGEFGKIIGVSIVGFQGVATDLKGAKHPRMFSGPDAIKELLEWSAENDAKGWKVKVTKITPRAKHANYQPNRPKT